MSTGCAKTDYFVTDFARLAHRDIIWLHSYATLYTDGTSFRGTRMNQPLPHILVVDDHAEIRDLLKRFLEQHGF